MDYFDNGPLIKSLDEIKSNNNSVTTKSNLAYWVVGIGFSIAAAVLYWYQNKKKTEKLKENIPDNPFYSGSNPLGTSG